VTVAALVLLAVALGFWVGIVVQDRANRALSHAERAELETLRDLLVAAGDVRVEQQEDGNVHFCWGYREFANAVRRCYGWEPLEIERPTAERVERLLQEIPPVGPIGPRSQGLG